MWAQPPALTHLTPAAVAPGKATDVVFFGTNLASPVGLWTSFASSSELTPGIDKNGTEPAQVSYRLTVGAEAPLGVAAVRLRTGQGVSNVRLLLVDDLASIAKIGTNKSPATAQVLSLPIAVDGACEAESSDFYKFTVAAGQRLAVEAFARRLGSPLDPTIRLLDGAGRELAFSDDEPATGVDSRFSYKFAAAGDYYLEVRDVRYQGGGGHRYRLRVGDFPLPTVPYPLAAPKGSSASLQVTGKSVELAGPVSVTMPPSVPGDRVNVATGYAPGQGSSWVTVLATDAVDQFEAEPNDSPDQCTSITVPGAFEGRFESRNDLDYYQLEAKKGTRMSFIGQTRSLGSPSDLYMRLFNADNGLAAEAEDNGTEEGTLTYTFPADGIYRLLVEDTNRRGGPDEVYRILVKPYEPGFSLQAAAEKVDAPQNGVFVVKVTAARRDYNGPITLGVEGAGDDCKLRHNVIPEGKPETTMHVTVGSSLTAGQLAEVKVVGTAKVGETDFRATASTLVALRASLAGLPFPPAVLDGTLALGVGPVFPKFFNLAAAAPSVALRGSNASAKLNVQLTRANGFDDKVEVKLDGLPKPAAAKPVTIEKGKTEAALELTSAQAIAPGKHVVRVVGNATFQNQPQQVVLESIALEGPPIAVAFAPAGAVSIGGKQKGTLTFAGDVAPQAPAAMYQSGVTRGAEGPRAPALSGFESDNKAAAFSGIDKAPGDDRLTCPLPIASTGDYTLELWLYNARDLSQPNSPAISGYVYSRPGTPTADNAQPGDHLGIGGVESSPRDKLFFYNGQTMVAGRTTLARDTWYHVALVRASDEVKVYLNGEVSTPEIQATAPKNYSASQIVLGTRSDGFAPFQGRLDEVAVFDAAIAPQQIQGHFATAKGATPARDVIVKDNPIAYWRLDERDGQLARSVATPHKRLVTLAWKNLPAGLIAPEQVVLLDGQNSLEVELAAAANAAPAKENILVAGTTIVGDQDFTAESPPVALEINKP